MIAVSSARAAALAAAGQENNPFVAWVNQARTAVLGGTAVLFDGAAANAVQGTTYDYWRPDVSATTARFRITLPVARSISFAAICAHTLGDLGASARIQRSTDGGSSWSDAGAGTLTPMGDEVLAWRMAQSGQDALDWSLYITGLTAGADVAVGVIFFGDDLVIPQRVYQGFAPMLTPTEVELQSNVTVGGNYAGSSEITRGSRFQMGLEHLTPDFVRGADWLAFQRAWNSGAPAFFGWRPTKYPQDVHYIWRDGATLRPANSGPKDYMSVDLEGRAYDG